MLSLGRLKKSHRPLTVALSGFIGPRQNNESLTWSNIDDKIGKNRFSQSAFSLHKPVILTNI